MLADLIARAREQAGLTQEQLARETGLSLVSISKYEQGTRSPRVESLGRIAVATGKPVSWFFGEAAA